MKSDIEMIQSKIIELLRLFIDVCENNDLTYYALGGTLLGAVRHKGFIPWDDDIDLGMPRADYERFKQIANERFNGKYQFLSEDTPGYRKAFSVIRDTSTRIMMNYSNVEQEESLWIDIFSIVNQNKADRPWHEKLIIKIANHLKIENILSFEKQQYKYLKTIKKYSVTEGYAGNFTGAYKLRELVPSDYFGKPTKLYFEGIELKCPNKYKDYLKAIYGEDYMTPPPIEQRVPHQYRIISLGENIGE